MAYPDPSLAIPFGKRGQGHPWYTVANQFMPRNLHDVIRWARYITMQSPTTTEVLRKLSTYPVTRFHIDTRDATLKEKYEDLIRYFKLKESLHDIGFEYHTTGNVFVSVYFPFLRMAKCKCGAAYNVRTCNTIKFANWNYSGTCPACGYAGEFTRVDSKVSDMADMNLIKWNPLHISVNHNPITGKSEYYYTIPGDIKKKVRMGDRMFIDTLPWEFIEAIKANQNFRFDNRSIFHLKNISAGHMVEGVSVPPLISMFGLVFYQATLRKANEAIASEHLSPLRVVFPQAIGANSDPIVSMSMRNFASNMQDAITKHKQDPNYFLVAPGPIGFQNIGGEGRNLLVSAEIEQAEASILMSLGVSKELLSGTTNWTSSTVGLRMLDNTLSSYTGQLNDLIAWVMESAAGYIGLERVKVDLTPFKLLDDENAKTILAGLESAGKVSTSTLLEAMDIDIDEERKRILADAIATAAADIRKQYEVEISQFLASKEVGVNMKGEEDYGQLLTQAQAIAEELVQADESQVRVQLHQLKITSYPMYLMVSKMLDEYHGTAQHKAKVEAGQEPGGSQEAQAASTEEGQTVNNAGAAQ